MKNYKTGIVIVTALVMAALGFMSCSSNSEKLISITVTPTDPVNVYGADPHYQFTATGTFSDGKILNFTSEVIWSSSSPTVATVGTTALSAGHVTVLTEGTTTITAVEPFNNFSSSSVLIVRPPIAITVTPENPVMTTGNHHQFTATATYLLSDNTTTATQNLISSSPTLTWDTSDHDIATISHGLVTAATTTTGSVIISATYLKTSATDTVTGSTILTVVPGKLLTITVDPATPSISLSSGPTTTLTATGNYDDSTTRDLTTSVEWFSSHTVTVVVSNVTGSKGLATALKEGTANIKATDPISKIMGTATVTVTQ